jgi:quercetin dioxygenase-like cupin family protein
MFIRAEDRPRQTIFPGVEIATAAGDQMMLSLVECQPNSVVERHAHPHEQVGIVLEGQARFIVGEDEQDLTPGDMYIIPGGVEHKVIISERGLRALDVFHPIREDYL